jgi:c-di-GMP-binding flagellar brake protein YcgR
MFAKFFGRSGQAAKPVKPKAATAATGAPERAPQRAGPADSAVPKDRNRDIPNRLEIGLQMRAVPEQQPGTPRAWNITVLKLDKEGIWISRTPTEADPLPVAPKEILCLVLLDEEKQISYDCPVLRIKPGHPELVLLGPPVKTTQESSKMSAIGMRQHFRVNFRFPCEIRNVSTKTNVQSVQVQGHTRDLSAGGMAVECKQEFTKGVDLEIRVMSWNFPLKVQVKVVRCYELSAGLYAVATIFPESLSFTSKELIVQFISENQRGGR